MTRMAVFNSPFLLGFDQIERTLDRLSKAAGDAYPPYNIEQIDADRFAIILAVAGFAADDLTVTHELNQLIIKGKQADDPNRTYLHRGIAARQFQRVFLLAEGIEVARADLAHGLLTLTLKRPTPQAHVRRIPIQTGEGAARPAPPSAPQTEIQLAGVEAPSTTRAGTSR
jgi:HSP20 family molecular chaperone IbpA